MSISEHVKANLEQVKSSLEQGTERLKSNFDHGKKKVRSQYEYGKELVSSGLEGAREARKAVLATEDTSNILGAALAFGVSFAWKTRPLTSAMAREAGKRIGHTRDRHWLSSHPINYGCWSVWPKFCGLTI